MIKLLDGDDDSLFFVNIEPYFDKHVLPVMDVATKLKKVDRDPTNNIPIDIRIKNISWMIYNHIKNLGECEKLYKTAFAV